MAEIAALHALSICFNVLGSYSQAEVTANPLRTCKMVASKAIAKAARLMDDDFSVLEAEAVLARALHHLGTRDGVKGDAAATNILQSRVFAEVFQRVQQYDSVSSVLESSNFKLVWEQDDARLWIHSPAGATWFEYRLVANVNASLRHCLVPLHERDLIIEYQPVFIKPHEQLGPAKRHHVIVRTLSKVLTFKVEAIFELQRVCNWGFGFLTERILSDLPPGGPSIPSDRSWWTKRVQLDTKNIWMPRGGNATGTVLISVSRVQVGVPMPASVLTFVFNSLGPSILNNVRKGSALAMEKGSLWNDRLQRDADGFYAELAEVEAVAAKRKAVSTTELPGREIFDRPWKLKAAADL